MENTVQRTAKCRSKTIIDQRSCFWQADRTVAAQEILAFITTTVVRLD